MQDLPVRVITAVLMAVLGFTALYFDGWVLLLLVSVLAALMAWELFHMAAPDRHLYAGIVALLVAAAVWFSGRDEMLFAMAMMGGAIVIGWVLAPESWRAVFPIYVFAIAAAGLGVFLIRDRHGFELALWLVLVVIATDVGGYFGGKFFGGTKFSPAISPGKTWTGIYSGWAASALVSVIMAPFVDLPWFELACVGIFFSAIAQIGDLCESMIKRKANVKDSSNILPGHGGVLDRFDGMIAVIVLALFLRGLLIA